ncbi:MAG: diacylglycerol kinase [Actinomycetota bacterium]|nr:diacylglycerol kinase [Actinomycetota bacterium]
MTARRILVLANLQAGTAEDEAVEAACAELRRGAAVTVRRTADAAELDEVLGARSGELVVVAGGDGSVHTVVSALHRAGTLAPDQPLGLLPLGTGNDLARALGVPLDPPAAARAVLSGVPRSLDLLVDDSGGIVVNAVHVGIGAEAARAAQGLKGTLGPAAYSVGSAVAGLRPHGWRLAVEVDGAVLADGGEPLLMVGIGNGTSIGGGAQLTPDAAPDDGYVDVVVSSSTGLLARLGYALDLREGDHVDREDVRVTRGRRIRVHGEDFCTNADGEIDGPFPSRTWTVTPRAWSLVVPSPAP